MAATDTAATSLSSILARFGVNYPNAPAPTPAMLAFMRGLGMNMDTAEDSARTTKLRLNERAMQSREEISRQNDRTLERMGSDVQSRGVLSSGETNKRVGRQAEEVAKDIGNVEQGLAEGIDSVETALGQTTSAYRQQALERTLASETEIANREAVNAANEKSWQRQQEASELSYKRQKEAQDAAFAAQEALYAKYAGLG